MSTKPKDGLTPKQREVYQFIQRSVLQGCAPTILEIQQEFGWKSSTSVTRHLEILEDRGLIERIPNQARGIRIPPQGDSTHIQRREIQGTRKTAGTIRQGVFIPSHKNTLTESQCILFGMPCLLVRVADNSLLDSYGIQQHEYLVCELAESSNCRLSFLASESGEYLHVHEILRRL